MAIKNEITKTTQLKDAISSELIKINSTITNGGGYR